MYYVESKYFCLSGFNVKYLSISGSLSLLSSCFSFIVLRLTYESHYAGQFIASDEDGIIRLGISTLPLIDTVLKFNYKLKPSSNS